jgi:AraC family transcriptional regulator, regulatory protein of adaptative response / methylated-DNA-[protein]-cysteine methyltransferase
MIRALASTPTHRNQDDARWDAVVARYAEFDGRFYYAVASTGVYCRPSCAARRPNRENVRFFASTAAAERAGFRPCKRCKPDQAPLKQLQAEKVAAACRLIETAEEEPTLDALADAVGVSAYHFHRLFKAATGVTPKAYASAHRRSRVRDRLGTSGTVTEAIYAAGFNSNGRFYAGAAEALGMTPTDFRQGGRNQMLRYAVSACSLGQVLVAASDKGIAAIFFGDDKDSLLADLRAQFPRARLIGGDTDFEQLVATVVAFVEDPKIGIDLPLDVRGTAFQHRVWDALRRIPVGSTASYAEIAEKIGAPGSARAVATACASNPIAVAIPCHRVVRSDGSLSGYRGGVERKRALLEKESKA